MYDHLKNTKVIEAITKKKTIFREPKSASDVDQVRILVLFLTEYQTQPLSLCLIIIRKFVKESMDKKSTYFSK